MSDQKIPICLEGEINVYWVDFNLIAEVYVKENSSFGIKFTSPYTSDDTELYINQETVEYISDTNPELITDLELTQYLRIKRHADENLISKLQTIEIKFPDFFEIMSTFTLDRNKMHLDDDKEVDMSDGWATLIEAFSDDQK